ncbi:uncharacterized protein LOC142342893 [Convolutriloba macropyga]|uniref:uncharacterized protein LOC142342893 n=1 Tax=Convolutriloba macropyga TaxID=536237 RepID=UPI003F52520C
MSFFIDRVGVSNTGPRISFSTAVASTSVQRESEHELAYSSNIEMEIPSGSDWEDQDQISMTSHNVSNVQTNIVEEPGAKRKRITEVKRPGVRLKNAKTIKSEKLKSKLESKRPRLNENPESKNSSKKSEPSFFIDKEGSFFCGGSSKTSSANTLIEKLSERIPENASKSKKGASHPTESETVDKTKIKNATEPISGSVTTEYKKPTKSIKRNNRNIDPAKLASKMEISEEVRQMYEKGDRFTSSHVKQAKVKHDLEQQQTRMFDAAEKAAKMDHFLTEQAGYVECEDEELLSLDQDTIQKNVDITNAQKRFDLSLKHFGPYKVNYTRNGRYLLIGGKLGHVAAFDWNKKSLCSEINVMETVNDICWLHNENMFAVAQKRWTYIYDRAGVELHALRQLDRVISMQFLPYHFLLATMNDLGFLTYLDVSMGKLVATLSTGLKNVREIKQNPQNAVIFSAHTNGIVNLWAPSSNKPLVKMACHKAAIASLTIDQSGNYLATCGVDRRLRIFDLRTFAPVHSYKLNVAARSLSFSQKGLLAAAFPRNVDIFRGINGDESVVKPYLSHRLHRSQIGNVEFCPFEDVLGIGHQLGVSSILVPGAGEPNFDALEANPFATKQQRKEAEVKSLLDKIQPEMISLEKSSVLKVNDDNDDEIKDKATPKAVQATLKNKAKGRNKSAKREKRKEGLKDNQRRKEIQEKNSMKRKEDKFASKEKSSKESKFFDPLARFKTKKQF